jgi:hypothetical protein
VLIVNYFSFQNVKAINSNDTLDPKYLGWLKISRIPIPMSQSSELSSRD